MKGIAMVSRRLCGVLAFEAILLLLGMQLLVGGTTPLAWLALTACAALVPLNLLIVAIVYAVVRRYAASFPHAGASSATRTWRCAVAEVLALFAAFAVIQPFERGWMGKERMGSIAAGRIPVLLVHGYLCNRGLWWWLRRRLRARHFEVATVNLEPPLAGLDRLAERLADRIDAVLAESGAEKVVLVTHSMGGLVSRDYLRRHGAGRVVRLVTLAAPHQGTQVARLGCGRGSRELQPGSERLRLLNAEPAPPIPLGCIWTLDDEFLVPPETAGLPGARETILEGIGHVAMVFSPRVFAWLEAELTDACRAAAA